MADGNGQTLGQRFHDLNARLAERFQERTAVIEGMVCAALAGEHVLLLGPPGTAKSALTREFCAAVSGTQYFEWLLSKFSAPEELFGPYALSGLKADRYVRVTSGKLPEAHVAFLDEIFKANSGVLNTLLTALNERKFHNGPQPTDLPLRMVVGASNELPEGPELGALYDRFLCRYWVDRVQTTHAFFAILGMEADPQPALLSLEQWDRARAEVAQVAFGKSVQQAFWNVRAELGKNGIHPSDRRFKRAVGLVKANAWLSGDREALDEHMGVLADVLWDHPDQRADVAKAVGQVSAGPLGEASKVRDLAMELVQKLPPPPQQITAEYQQALINTNKEGRRALARLTTLVDNARNPRKAEQIRKMVKEVDQALAPVRSQAREVLGL